MYTDENGELQSFSVRDILIAEVNLEPLVCLHCEGQEVTFNQSVNDAYCAECGQWQEESCT